MTPQVRWSVGLSNGQNYYEGKGDFEIVKGEISPWRKLNKHIDKKGVEITSISLYKGNKRWNLPSAGNQPKFSAFDNAEKPKGYRFFRKVGFDILGKDGGEEHFAVIEAQYENYKLQTWVKDKEPYPSWSLII